MAGVRRPWLRVLLISACAAAAVGSAAAQSDGGLVYEKRLDLSLNPTRGGGGPGQMAGTAWQPRAARELRPQADTAHTGHAVRIIEGKPATPGDWRSTVNLLYVHTGADGKDNDGVCGGTVIDGRWVLTAAHCIFHSRTGGLQTLKWVSAFASQKVFDKAAVLPVKAAYVHRAFEDVYFINDIALLELESPIALPRQKLMAAAGQASFLAPGAMATVVGWGLTKPWWGPEGKPGDISPVLQQASMPLPGKAVCDAFRLFASKPGRPLQDDQFCAGYGQDESKPRICNGDSGGPLFLAGEAGEPIQAGITSWNVRGCPSYYAVFANVGHFEAWIRERVPNAVFVLPPRTGAPAGPLPAIAGIEAGGAPAPNGQCAVDIAANGVATSRVTVGAKLTVRVSSGVTGDLAVFSRNASGAVVQLYPHRLGGPAAEGAAEPMAVRAGDTVAIPASGDSFVLRASPPTGHHVIIAVVVPEAVGLAGLTRGFDNMLPIDDFRGVMEGIAEATLRAGKVSHGTRRAVCTRQFLVVE